MNIEQRFNYLEIINMMFFQVENNQFRFIIATYNVTKNLIN